MSVNTKSRARRLVKHWRKMLILLGALIFAPSTILFGMYLAFWIGRWTVGLSVKVSKTKKETKQ